MQLISVQYPIALWRYPGSILGRVHGRPGQRRAQLALTTASEDG